jgi:hypothetical protein
MRWNEVAGAISDGLSIAREGCLGVSQLRLRPEDGSWVIRTQAAVGFWAEFADYHGKPTLHARLLHFPEGETYIVVTLRINDWRHEVVMPASLQEVRSWLVQVRTTGAVCLEIREQRSPRKLDACLQVDAEFMAVVGAAGNSPGCGTAMKHYLFVIAATAAAADASWYMRSSPTRRFCDSVAPVVPLAFEIGQEAANQALLLIHQL